VFTSAADLASIPACNVTSSGAATDRIAADLKRTIHALYEPDFGNFRYAA
jgi:hypothetical protein